MIRRTFPSCWLWSQVERPRLASIARAAADPDTPIISWGIYPNGYIYYVGRKPR